jgi:phospholipid/cholesterol/gamma-HCH transport system substrate-binding protein/paraquat-inducible protein B
MTDARNFRVGLFVLGGLVLIVAFALALGGGSLFRTPMMFETYFDESVQGLEVGSPVKFRGVKIGTVSGIGFVGDHYELGSTEDELVYGSKVLVRMRLEADEDETAPSSDDRPGVNLEHMIDRGLRLRLTSQGITGTSFVQADYVSPGQHPPMKIIWTPRSLYIPSAPSVFREFSRAAERILTRLEEADVEKVLDNLNGLIVSLTRTVDGMDGERFQRDVTSLIDDLRGTNARIQRSIESGKYDFEVALENLRVASENLRDLTDTAKSYPSLMILGNPPPEGAAQ